MMDACTTTKVDYWLDIAADAVKEFSATCLGMEETDVEVVGKDTVPPRGMAGAYLALVSLDDAVQIGFVSDETGCKAISGAMLAMEEDELEELTQSDIKDTMGEVVNIVAGMVKTKMVNINPDLNLGLPIFLTGPVEPLPQQEFGTVQMKIGSSIARVVIIRQSDPDAETLQGPST